MMLPMPLPVPADVCRLTTTGLRVACEKPVEWMRHRFNLSIEVGTSLYRGAYHLPFRRRRLLANQGCIQSRLENSSASATP